MIVRTAIGMTLIAAGIASLAAAPFARDAHAYTDIGAPLPNVDHSGVAWGDYDNDGDLDILLTGRFAGFHGHSAVYRNDGGSFVNIGAPLADVRFSAAAWGDYDGDGDLDLLIAGIDGGDMRRTLLYRNDSGAFVFVPTPFEGLSWGQLAWADYDNDGDLDVLIAGLGASGNPITRLYRNDGAGTFVDANAGLPGVTTPALSWADYDGDDDLDLLLCGWDGATPSFSRLYRNDGGGAFTSVPVPFLAVDRASIAWGDCDNDGDLDVAIAGMLSSTAPATRLYRNDGAQGFTLIPTTLPNVHHASIAWGDQDNDGDLDLVLSGLDASISSVTAVYLNDGTGTGFSPLGGFLPVGYSSVAWGDYDADGDLDLLLTGSSGGPGAVSRVYRNDATVPNSPPTTPGNLTSLRVGGRVVFSWTPAADAETPAAALSYNLRVGTTPGGAEITGGMSSASSGYRRVPAHGNAQQGLSWSLVLPPGSYSWSVQAIDGAFAGGPFAAEAVHTELFADAAPGLPGLFNGSTAWGDHDGDGDLDLLVSGLTAGAAAVTTVVYRNSGGPSPTFSDAGANLPGFHAGSSAWGDYDGDGDLDILMTGLIEGGGPASRIYRNGGGANPEYTDAAVGLPGLYVSAGAWGDYDNDGDLDIALSGYDTSSEPVTRILRNEGGSNPTFTDIGVGLPGLSHASVAWGDLEGDGDLDLLISGRNAANYSLSRLYRNGGGPNPVFAEYAAPLWSVHAGAARWGDYDGDGDLDILLTGLSAPFSPTTRIYRNEGGLGPDFTDIGAALPALYEGTAEWGDYDNDGDLDVLLAGRDASTSARMCRVHINEGGGNPVFASSIPVRAGVGWSSAAWGDYDGDGDLDVALTGEGDDSAPHTKIYRSNLAGPANTPPTAPSGLTAQFTSAAVTFSWSAAADAQTQAPGLSYNLRAGASPAALDIVSPMADPATGVRRVAADGRLKIGSWVTRPQRVRTDVHWSVQAIDGAFAGGPFAPAQILPLAPSIESASDVPADQGGWLYLTVDRAPFDTETAAIPVASYGIWRQVPGPAAAAATEPASLRAIEPVADDAPALERLRAAVPDDLPVIETNGRILATGPGAAAAGFPAGTWALVASMPALQQPQYVVAAPTTSNAGPSTYVVTANTTTPSIWFVSAAVSGQSVDNLAPAQPAGFTGAYSAGAARLDWDAVAAHDLAGYRLYRGATSDFVPGPGHLVVTVTTTSYDDPAAVPGDFFKLSAIDVNGNESGFALTQAGVTSDAGDPRPLAFGLDGARPNPARGGRLQVAFALADAAPARLALVDMSGRRVVEREVGALGAGRHAVDLADGVRLAPGLYWVRLTQGLRAAAIRVVVLD